MYLTIDSFTLQPLKSISTTYIKHHVKHFFFFQAEDGIRDTSVTGVQTCALPISTGRRSPSKTSRCSCSAISLNRFSKKNARPSISWAQPPATPARRRSTPCAASAASRDRKSVVKGKSGGLVRRRTGHIDRRRAAQ